MFSDIQLYLSDAYDYAPVYGSGSLFIERNASKGRLNDGAFFGKTKDCTEVFMLEERRRYVFK